MRLLRSEEAGTEEVGGIPPDSRSVAVVYRAHAEELLRFATRLAGDRHVAADAVQEAFLRLLENPTAVTAPRAWLFRVVSNLVVEHGRTAQRHTRLARQANSPLPPRSPLKHAIDADSRSRIAAALSQLRERERVAVLMRHEGFTHREIAAELGTTTGTIGTLLARAFDKLADTLRLDDDA